MREKMKVKGEQGTEYTYTVILKPQPEGVFTVNVPALPGCITEGRTEEDALKNAREAIELYLETLIEDGQPIPEDIKPVTRVLHLKLSQVIDESETPFPKA